MDPDATIHVQRSIFVFCRTDGVKLTDERPPASSDRSENSLRCNGALIKERLDAARILDSSFSAAIARDAGLSGGVAG